MWAAFARRWTSQAGMHYLDSKNTPSSPPWLSVPTTLLLTSPAVHVPPNPKTVNLALMCGRDDPPTSPKDLYRRLIASPMCPTDKFMFAAVDSPAATGTYGHTKSPKGDGGFEFVRGASSTAFKWVTSWGLTVTLVLRVPATHAVLSIIDVPNAHETIVLAWNKEEDPPFSEYDCENKGPLVHHIPMYNMFKRALQQTPNQVDAEGIHPVIAMITAYRNIVRMVPRFSPDAEYMDSTVLRHKTTLTPKELFYLLIEQRNDPDVAALNNLATGQLRMVKEDASLPALRSYPNITWHADISDTRDMCITWATKGHTFKTPASASLKLSMVPGNCDWDFTLKYDDYVYVHINDEEPVSTFPDSAVDTDADVVAVALCTGFCDVFGKRFAGNPELTDGALALLQYRTVVRLLWAAATRPSTKSLLT
jgi:hypothetical protein